MQSRTLQLPPALMGRALELYYDDVHDQRCLESIVRIVKHTYHCSQSTLDTSLKRATKTRGLY